ncbi:hypothetical protein SteCoe_11200 [Stentor coeruleus]|uniref:Uncharacterized protein n=1 Tax=Stentor coeruleus TaxID=5963 RepID=A0A1R2CDN7_9CILI|nr:hypothetical protein SteCoe_11200 [Stentor coeruleus]
MGNSRSEPNLLKKSYSEVFTYYVNRSESFVLRLTQTSTKKLKFSIDKCFPSDSVLGYLDENTIIIAGGTSKSKSLRTRCYLINLEYAQLNILTPLPIPAKLGGLFKYKTDLYYAGGVTEKKSGNNQKEFSGCPIMRYNLNDNSWEVFIHKEEQGDDGVLNSCEPSSLSENSFKIENLIYPGCFLLGSKLYYFAGAILPSYTPSRSVYSINLESETKELQIEPYSFPINIFNPLSGSSSKTAFIWGGLSPSSKPIQSCYMFTHKNGFSEILSPGLDYFENYPIKVTEEYIIIMAFPKFAIKFMTSHRWIHYTASLNFNMKSQTVIIKDLNNTDSIKKAPIVRDAKILIPKAINLDTDDALDSVKNLSMRTFDSGKDARTFKTESSKSRSKNSYTLKTSETGNFSNDVFQSKNMTFLSKDDILSMVIIKKNDMLVRLPRKRMIKVICQIYSKILTKDLSPLEISKLSSEFGEEKEISIKQLYVCLKKNLGFEFYTYKKVHKFISILDRVLEKPKLHFQSLDQIIEFLNISMPAANIEKKKCIMVITRVVKAMII